MRRLCDECRCDLCIAAHLLIPFIAWGMIRFCDVDTLGGRDTGSTRMGNEQDGDKREGNEFDRKVHELRSGVTPRFLVRLTGGAWELLRQAPALGSGPY